MGTYNRFEKNIHEDSYDRSRITLPLPPVNTPEAKVEMQVYVHFMRHLRQVPNSRMDVKILAAIQFTSDAMDSSDALIAKMLADLGLRAPRRAFPVAFLDFADKSVARQAWEIGNGPAPSILALKEHWDKIGEDRFSVAIRSQYALSPESAFVGV